MLTSVHLILLHRLLRCYMLRVFAIPSLCVCFCVFCAFPFTVVLLYRFYVAGFGSISYLSVHFNVPYNIRSWSSKISGLYQSLSRTFKLRFLNGYHNRCIEFYSEGGSTIHRRRIYAVTYLALLVRGGFGGRTPNKNMQLQIAAP